MPIFTPSYGDRYRFAETGVTARDTYKAFLIGLASLYPCYFVDVGRDYPPGLWQLGVHSVER